MVSRIETGFKGVKENKIVNFARILGTSINEILSKEEKEIDIENAIVTLRNFEYKIEFRVDLPETLEQLECMKNTNFPFQSWIYYLTGKIHSYEKRIKKAKRDYEISINIARRMLDKENTNVLSLSLNALSFIEYQKNNFRETIELNNEAIQSWDENGHRQPFYPWLIDNKIVFHNKIGKIHKVRKEILHLWNIRNEINDINVKINTYEHYSKLLSQDNLFDDAIECLIQGIIICNQNKRTNNLIELVTSLCSIEAKVGKTEQAKAKLNSILTFKKTPSDQTLFISAYIELGKIHMKEKKIEPAKLAFNCRVIKICWSTICRRSQIIWRFNTI